MAVYQFDLEKQHLAPEGGHNYAWTNVYLVDCASDGDAEYRLLHLVEIEAGILPIDTSIRFVCWRQGIGGPVPSGIQLIGRHGDLPAGSAYQPFSNTARVTGYSGRRLAWYKRWRGPLRDIDMTGGLLSNDYHALLTTAYVDRLRSEVPLVTRSGERISTWSVDPRIMLWQRRDGSDRNIRSVLAG